MPQIVRSPMEPRNNHQVNDIDWWCPDLKRGEIVLESGDLFQ